MQITVRDLMSQKPVTVDQDAQLDDALATLIREEASEVYVTDVAGKLVGVVADYELLKATLIGEPGDLSVTDLMCRQMMTFEPDADLDTAAGTFRDGRYRRVVVVDDGRPVGQISRGDILRSLANRATQQHADVADRDVADREVADREVADREVGDQKDAERRPTTPPRKPQYLSATVACERSSQVESA